MVKKKSEYRTAWFLTDEWETDKRIYGLIDALYSKPPKNLKNVELWGQYLAFCYLSLARRTEPFRMNPTITKVVHNKHVFYRITRINEKLFEGTRIAAEKRRKNANGKIIKSADNKYVTPKRVAISQLFMPLNEYERALFELLLKGRQQVTLDFTPLLFPYKYNAAMKRAVQSESLVKDTAVRERERQLMANFSHRFSLRFPAIITDGKQSVESSLVPHMIRHIRTYNLKSVKGFPRDVVQKLGGWKTDMVGYYVDVRRSMAEEDMLRFYDSLPGK